MYNPRYLKFFVTILLYSSVFHLVRDALGLVPAILLSSLTFGAFYLLSQANNRVFYSTVLLCIVASIILYRMTNAQSSLATKEGLAGNWQSESEVVDMGIYFWADSAQVSQAPYADTVAFHTRLDKDSLRLYQDEFLRFSWKIRITNQEQWQIEHGKEIISFHRKPAPLSRNPI